jgi:ABC-type lipoprotein export system ATPase subunit
VLLGPSGSGKSTLLNILGGLDVATSGEVTFGTQNLSAATEAELTAYRRRHVGFVFQFYNLIPSLTVRENVALVTDIGLDRRNAARMNRVTVIAAFRELGGAWALLRAIERLRGSTAPAPCSVPIRRSLPSPGPGCPAPSGRGFP